MILFGSSFSPFARKALVFVGEKGLRVEHRPVPPQDRAPEFQAASPLGRIPALVDGAYQLADSSAICHYLERKYPTPALFPAGAEELGRMVWFEEFADTVLIPTTGKVFFQIVVRPRLMKEPTDMAVVDQALTKEIPPLFDYLERQVTGPFLIGGKLSLADIAIHCSFVNLKLAGHPLDAARWPKLGEYLAGLLARPAFGVRDPK
ncbi:MAG TPA: glutathione S-transferase family protein [Stellaceae bacterium]|nr:glutathione S-transferase family protein [Stellaceae bacterium]